MILIFWFQNLRHEQPYLLDKMMEQKCFRFCVWSVHILLNCSN